MGTDDKLDRSRACNIYKCLSLKLDKLCVSKLPIVTQSVGIAAEWMQALVQALILANQVGLRGDGVRIERVHQAWLLIVSASRPPAEATEALNRMCFCLLVVAGCCWLLLLLLLGFGFDWDRVGSVLSLSGCIVGLF